MVVTASHVCERCGGKGTVWTGRERIVCPRCNGSGSGLSR